MTPRMSSTPSWRCEFSTGPPTNWPRSTCSGSRLKRSSYTPAVSRRRTPAPVDQTTATVRAASSIVAGSRVARRVWRSGSIRQHAERRRRLRRLARLEAQPELAFALAVGGDLGVQLFHVPAERGDFTATTGEACGD